MTDSTLNHNTPRMSKIRRSRNAKLKPSAKVDSARRAPLINHSTSMRTRIALLCLGAIFALYLTSLAGILFLSSGYMLLGFLAFALTFLAGVLQNGFRLQRLQLKRLWAYVAPLLLILFISTFALSYPYGLKPDNLPVFAVRGKYELKFGEEISRLRYITAACCFYLFWHVGLMVFAAERWAAIRSRRNGHHVRNPLTSDAGNGPPGTT